MISLPNLVERAVRLNPDGMATHYLNRRRTWTEFRGRVSRLASGLRGIVLEEGDRVAVLSLNSDRYFESIFAIPWAGYCLVPLNTRWAVPENEYAINDSGSRVLLFDDAFTEQAKTLLDTCPALVSAVYMGEGDCPEWALGYEGLVTDNAPVLMSGRSGDDMVGIFYTGGTTGFPKGVVHCHKAIWASAVGALPDFQMTRDSTYLHAAPMFHIADFAGTMNALLRCCGNYILQTFDPGQVLNVISEQRISHTLLVPAMIKMVLNHPEAPGADVSSLECIIYGASPMPVASLTQCMAMWPSVDLAQAYGQTELAPVATTLSRPDHRKGGDKLKSAGRPTSVSDVRIVDGEGRDCAVNVSGEIAVSGPHTMLGYWNKPDETARALQDGWVFTGDAGMFDEDGYLYIVDR